MYFGVSWTEHCTVFPLVYRPGVLYLFDSRMPWHLKIIEDHKALWFTWVTVYWGASQVALVVKNPPARAEGAGEVGSIPGSGKPPGVGNGNPLQYSCLEKPMDRGAWWAPVHGAANGPTRLSNCARSHYVLIFSIVEIEKHFKHKNTQICDSVRCQRNYIFTCQVALRKCHCTLRR